ncbi:MAG: DUF445 family protein [Deltaproteobacteria bacterium]|nr:DUF445 family protein [Deltaproteobacteria bacterium]
MQIPQTISDNLPLLILVPTIAALIGWVTNFLAVKMIFRPRRPFRIFGLRIHGLIPRRQKELAISIGETVQRDLISHKDVQKVLSSSDVEARIRKLAGEQIDLFISRIISENPMVAMFIQGSLAATIKERLVDQMSAIAPTFLDQVMQQVEDNLDFKHIVQEKIEGFDLSKLEEIIYRISSKELKMIEVLGGVLGFIVGLAQVALMLVMQ